MSDLAAGQIASSSRKVAIQIFWLFISFSWMISANYLANAIPLNGYSTGAVSALYPNLFVPAGFTFSIWGIIYLLLIGWMINAIVILRKQDLVSFTWRHVRSLINPFYISCFLNGLWIFAWHYLQVGLSLFIMILLLVNLIILYSRMQTYQSAMTGWARIWLYHAFVVYLAWISVATIANTTALLVYIKWDGFGLDDQYWSCIMMSIALILGFLMGYKRAEAAYVLVLAWAFYGIAKGQSSQSGTVSMFAYGCAAVSLLIAFIGLWKSGKKASIDGVL
jgi:benzodiazapine receptor